MANLVFSKAENISKFFTKNTTAPAENESAGTSTYTNKLTKIKKITLNDDDDFKTPKPVKKLAKIFTNPDGLQTQSKRKYVKRGRVSKRNPLQKTIEDTFRKTDVNGEHLQMAVALSMSAQETQRVVLRDADDDGDSNYIEDDRHIPVFPSTQEVRENARKTLEQYGFKSSRSGKSDVHATKNVEISKRKKKSRYHYIKPILFLRTDEDREEIINYKVAKILNECLVPESKQTDEDITVHSKMLQLYRCISDQTISKNNLPISELHNQVFYVDKLNLSPSDYKCGILLKRWEDIPGRELSPVRCIVSLKEEKESVENSEMITNEKSFQKEKHDISEITISEGNPKNVNEQSSDSDNLTIKDDLNQTHSFDDNKIEVKFNVESTTSAIENESFEELKNNTYPSMIEQPVKSEIKVNPELNLKTLSQSTVRSLSPDLFDSDDDIPIHNTFKEINEDVIEVDVPMDFEENTTILNTQELNTEVDISHSFTKTTKSKQKFDSNKNEGTKRKRENLINPVFNALNSTEICETNMKKKDCDVPPEESLCEKVINLESNEISMEHSTFRKSLNKPPSPPDDNFLAPSKKLKKDASLMKTKEISSGFSQNHSLHPELLPKVNMKLDSIISASLKSNLNNTSTESDDRDFDCENMNADNGICHYESFCENEGMLHMNNIIDIGSSSDEESYKNSRLNKPLENDEGKSQTKIKKLNDSKVGEQEVESIEIESSSEEDDSKGSCNNSPLNKDKINVSNEGKCQTKIKQNNKDKCISNFDETVNKINKTDLEIEKFLENQGDEEFKKDDHNFPNKKEAGNISLTDEETVDNIESDAKNEIITVKEGVSINTQFNSNINQNQSIKFNTRKSLNVKINMDVETPNRYIDAKKKKTVSLVKKLQANLQQDDEKEFNDDFLSQKDCLKKNQLSKQSMSDVSKEETDCSEIISNLNKNPNSQFEGKLSSSMKTSMDYHKNLEEFTNTNTLSKRQGHISRKGKSHQTSSMLEDIQKSDQQKLLHDGELEEFSKIKNRSEETAKSKKKKKPNSCLIRDTTTTTTSDSTEYHKNLEEFTNTNTSSKRQGNISRKGKSHQTSPMLEDIQMSDQQQLLHEGELVEISKIKNSSEETAKSKKKKPNSCLIRDTTTTTTTSDSTEYHKNLEEFTNTNTSSKRQGTISRKGKSHQTSSMIEDIQKCDQQKLLHDGELEEISKIKNCSEETAKSKKKKKPNACLIRDTTTTSTSSDLTETEKAHNYSDLQPEKINFKSDIEDYKGTNLTENMLDTNNDSAPYSKIISPFLTNISFSSNRTSLNITAHINHILNNYDASFMKDAFDNTASFLKGQNLESPQEPEVNQINFRNDKPTIQSKEVNEIRVKSIDNPSNHEVEETNTKSVDDNRIEIETHFEFFDKSLKKKKLDRQNLIELNCEEDNVIDLSQCSDDSESDAFPKCSNMNLYGCDNLQNLSQEIENFKRSYKTKKFECVSSSGSDVEENIKMFSEKVVSKKYTNLADSDITGTCLRKMRRTKPSSTSERNETFVDDKNKSPNTSDDEIFTKSNSVKSASIKRKSKRVKSSQIILDTDETCHSIELGTSHDENISISPGRNNTCDSKDSTTQKHIKENISLSTTSDNQIPSKNFNHTMNTMVQELGTAVSTECVTNKGRYCKGRRKEFLKNIRMALDEEQALENIERSLDYKRNPITSDTSKIIMDQSSEHFIKGEIIACAENTYRKKFKAKVPSRSISPISITTRSGEKTIKSRSLSFKTSSHDLGIEGNSESINKKDTNKHVIEANASHSIGTNSKTLKENEGKQSQENNPESFSISPTPNGDLPLIANNLLNEKKLNRDNSSKCNKKVTSILLRSTSFKPISGNTAIKRKSPEYGFSKRTLRKKPRKMEQVSTSDSESNELAHESKNQNQKYNNEKFDDSKKIEGKRLILEKIQLEPLQDSELTKGFDFRNRVEKNELTSNEIQLENKSSRPVYKQDSDDLRYSSFKKHDKKIEILQDLKISKKFNCQDQIENTNSKLEDFNQDEEDGDLRIPNVFITPLENELKSKKVLLENKPSLSKREQHYEDVCPILRGDIHEFDTSKVLNELASIMREDDIKSSFQKHDSISSIDSTTSQNSIYISDEELNYSSMNSPAKMKGKLNQEEWNNVKRIKSKYIKSTNVASQKSIITERNGSYYNSTTIEFEDLISKRILTSKTSSIETPVETPLTNPQESFSSQESICISDEELNNPTMHESPLFKEKLISNNSEKPGPSSSNGQNSFKRPLRKKKSRFEISDSESSGEECEMEASMIEGNKVRFTDLTKQFEFEITLKENYIRENKGLSAESQSDDDDVQILEPDFDDGEEIGSKINVPSDGNQIVETDSDQHKIDPIVDNFSNDFNIDMDNYSFIHNSLVPVDGDVQNEMHDNTMNSIKKNPHILHPSLSELKKSTPKRSLTHKSNLFFEDTFANLLEQTNVISSIDQNIANVENNPGMKYNFDNQKQNNPPTVSKMDSQNKRGVLNKKNFSSMPKELIPKNCDVIQLSPVATNKFSQEVNKILSPKKYGNASEAEGTVTPNGRVVIKTRNVSPMPDYEAMDTPRIHEELARFGMKKLRRARGVELLKYIYESTHPFMDSKKGREDRGSCRKVKRRKLVLDDEVVKGNSPKVVTESILHAEQIDCIGDMVNLGEPESDMIFEKKHSKRILSCQLPLHIAWHNFLCVNPEIRENILLYEPLQVEVLYGMLKEQGFKYNIQDLISFLDKKCITIRMN